MYQNYRTIFQGKSMPFAYVDLDLLDTNIKDILKRANGMPIRVASKSVRCVAILKHIFAANSAFQGVMCYTAMEAVHLSQQGGEFSDLLVAYPCWNENHIAAVC